MALYDRNQSQYKSRSDFLRRQKQFNECDNNPGLVSVPGWPAKSTQAATLPAGSLVRNGRSIKEYVNTEKPKVSTPANNNMRYSEIWL